MQPGASISFGVGHDRVTRNGDIANKIGRTLRRWRRRDNGGGRSYVRAADRPFPRHEPGFRAPHPGSLKSAPPTKVLKMTGPACPTVPSLG